MILKLMRMEVILDYITRRKYFYEFLKPLADTTNLVDADFIDWEMLITT
jgi:hypothetical protein